MELYPYQQKALQTYVDKDYFALFFEPGLGKTATLISILREKMKRGYVRYPLIVPPKPLLSVWVSEFDKFWPDHPPLCFLDKNAVVSSLETKIYITNVDKFSYSFSPAHFSLIDFICLDEATKIKSMSSNRTKNLLKLSQKIKQRAILTGTPFTSSPLSLYPLLRFLSPSLISTPYSLFRDSYAVTVSPPMGRGRIIISEKIWERIKNMTYQASFNVFKIYPNDYFYIQSSSSFAPYKNLDKLTPLCEKVGMFAKATSVNSLTVRYFENKAYTHLSSLEKQEIEENGGSVMAYQMALRKKASLCKEKLEGLMLDLESFLENKEKVVIVTYFLSSFDLITSHLIKENIEFVGIRGETTEKQREEYLKKFNNDCNVLVGSLGVIAYGLNLQTSHIMLFYDSLYHYEDYVQCKKRIDRIGQKEIPRYFHYLLKDSLEEGIYKLIEEHKDINNYIESLLSYYIQEKNKK